MSPLELRSSLCVIVVDMSPMSHLVLRPSSLPVLVCGAVGIPARLHPFRLAGHLRNVHGVTVCVARGSGALCDELLRRILSGWEVSPMATCAHRLLHLLSVADPCRSRSVGT